MARQRIPATARPHEPSISSQLALKRLRKLLDLGASVRAAGHRSSEITTWEGDLKILLAEFYGEDSAPLKQFNKIWFTPGAYYGGQPESEFVEAFNSGMDQAMGFLRSRIEDLSDNISSQGTNPSTFAPDPKSRKVFVVHGHDHGTKETVARFLERLELEPVILHEQPDQGRTIIEKFETHVSDVQCAVVVLTADDTAQARENPANTELRARQNVIFELGFFNGKLGRNRTFALVGKGVALPSDFHGVIYISLETEDWRLRLVKELRAAGLQVDANRAF